MTRAPGPALRDLAGFTVAFALVSIALLASAVPAAAACDGPVPSFRKAITTATRVVVGEVVAVKPDGLWDPAVDGRSSRFTLRVRDVLRGTAPAEMEIRDLPTQPCASVVIASTGDRIALAFDALDFDPPVHVNAVAWIRGTPTLGFETITLLQVLSLMSVPATDAWAPESDGSSRWAKDNGWPVGAILSALAGVAAAFFPWPRFGRSGRRGLVPSDQVGSTRNRANR